MIHIVHLIGNYSIYFADRIDSLVFYNQHTDFSIPLIILVLLIFSLGTMKGILNRKKDIEVKKSYKNDMLGIDITTQLRGIAILVIIVYHFTTKLFYPGFIYYTLFNNLNDMGVGFFLIISGFGLTQSFLKKGIEKNYLVKRFTRILIPYFIIMIGLVILDKMLLNLNHPSIYLALNLIGVIITASYTQNVDPFMWYITILLFDYAVFYILFRSRLSNLVKICVFLIIAVILEILHPLLLKEGFISLNFWAAYSLCFPVGVIIALNYKRIQMFFKTLSRKNSLLFLLSLFFVLLFFGVNKTWLWGSIIVILGLIMFNLSLYSRFLYFVGTISYELYLIHGSFLIKYDFFLFKFPYFISFFLYLIFVICISYLVKELVSNKLVDFINKKLNIS